MQAQAYAHCNLWSCHVPRCNQGSPLAQARFTFRNQEPTPAWLDGPPPFAVSGLFKAVVGMSLAEMMMMMMMLCVCVYYIRACL